MASVLWERRVPRNRRSPVCSTRFGFYDNLMPESDPTQPFYLIVTDNDRGVFSVEGPMTDDRAWNAAARFARDQHQRRITCGPTGPDRDALAAEYRRAQKLAGVPPGSIVRPHR
jgi:hypothetical protein